MDEFDDENALSLFLPFLSSALPLANQRHGDDKKQSNNKKKGAVSQKPNFESGGLGLAG